MNSKQQAFDLFAQKRKEFLEYCRWVAVRLYKQRGNITIDDVRDEVPLPLGINGKVFGAVFNTEDWELISYVKTTRQTSHGRRVAVWKYIGSKPTYQVTNSGQVAFI
jgi:hypothetical protein